MKAVDELVYKMEIERLNKKIEEIKDENQKLIIANDNLQKKKEPQREKYYESNVIYTRE